MGKVTITTAHKGFNYGTSLQAYASKSYITSLGYDAEIVWYKEGFIKGRDIRLRKLIFMFLRTFWRPSLFKKTLLSYKSSLTKEINEDAKKIFLEFTEKELNIQSFSWRELKEYVRKEEVIACICGSDQIWNATNIYIDPIYYLKFAPRKKRVAYAPSFGKDEIPKYNKNAIKRNISQIDYLSVREEQGSNIINELVGREVPVMIDPTLLLNKEDWLKAIRDINNNDKKKYILLYFLDKPSQEAMRYIENLMKIYKCDIISIPNKHDEFEKFDNCNSFSTGPLEFIDLIANSLFVCTDSFHGMAFSINLNTPFFIFKRVYGAASDQSSRIVSLLEKLELQDRFINETEASGELYIDYEMSFDNSNILLEGERVKAKTYLLDAFSNIKNNLNYGGNNE